MVASNMVSAAPTAVDIRTEMDDHSTRLSTIDAVVSLLKKVRFNKRVYNKTTGVETVYDDNDTTPLLRQTVSGDTTVTRTSNEV
jgi:hypothetical protein